MQTHNNARKIQGIIPLCIPLLLAGCSKQTPAEENVLIVEKPQEEVDYNLTVVTKGDVSETQKIKCTYSQLNEQDVSFQVSGKRIAKVYVEDGDSVVKGQLLAELSNDHLDTRITSLQYQISRNTLLLEQLNELEEDSLAKIELQYSQSSSNQGAQSSEWEKEKEKDIQSLYDSNKYAKQGYQDSIELDTEELEMLQAEQASCCIYASMDGIIADREKDLEGSTCVKGETILRIIDDSECIFVSTDTDYRDYFSEDSILSMSLSGSSQGSYQLTPYHYKDWGEEMYFSILSCPDDANLNVGDLGNIELVLAEHTNVLTLPASAIHTADGAEYVYILNENSVREVKWVETGLHGKNTVEITANLSEGDKVFIK